MIGVVRLWIGQSHSFCTALLELRAASADSHPFGDCCRQMGDKRVALETAETTETRTSFVCVAHPSGEHNYTLFRREAFTVLRLAGGHSSKNPVSKLPLCPDVSPLASNFTLLLLLVGDPQTRKIAKTSFCSTLLFCSAPPCRCPAAPPPPSFVRPSFVSRAPIDSAIVVRDALLLLLLRPC